MANQSIAFILYGIAMRITPERLVPGGRVSLGAPIGQDDGMPYYS